jgi:hypothetical protein
MHDLVRVVPLHQGGRVAVRGDRGSLGSEQRFAEGVLAVRRRHDQPAGRLRGDLADLEPATSARCCWAAMTNAASPLTRNAELDEPWFQSDPHATRDRYIILGG